MATTKTVKLLTAEQGMAAMDAIVARQTAGLTNHAYIPSWDEQDGCPKHGSAIKKTYTFGMNDAEVTVFDGCKCAVCFNSHSACLGGMRETDTTYHTSYSSAAGRAVLIREGAKIW